MAKDEKLEAVVDIESRDSSQEKNAVLEAIRSADVDKGVVGFDLYEKAQEIDAEQEKLLYKKIVRKVDMRIVPLLCVTYTLQFLDKLSLNYASAYSFKEDLDLYGQRYSWVAAIFNFGYLFWALPGNYIIQRVPVGKYTGLMLFTWAVILIGHIGATNYAGMLVLRFLLGMFEASISPACMNICGSFYTIKQQPVRMCIFLSFNGVATMVGALLGFGLGHATSAAIKPWKLIFLVIGLMNFVWSIVFTWFCPDSPATAKFLTEEERAILVKEVASNNMGIKDKRFLMSQATEGLLDVGAWILALIGLCCGIINGGASNFSSALIKGYGFTGIQATALQLPTGAIEFVVVAACGFIAMKIKNTRCILMFLVCIPPLGGLIGIHTISLQHRWSLVGCTFLQFMIGAPVILTWVLLNANVSGFSKKTVANGMWFLAYAGGNIIGANVFLARQAPKYRLGIFFLIGGYAIIMASSIAYGFLLVYRNKKKTELYGEYTPEMAQQAIIDGFKGMTDFENPGFRYCY